MLAGKPEMDFRVFPSRWLSTSACTRGKDWSLETCSRGCGVARIAEKSLASLAGQGREAPSLPRGSGVDLAGVPRAEGRDQGQQTPPSSRRSARQICRLCGAAAYRVRESHSLISPPEVSRDGRIRAICGCRGLDHSLRAPLRNPVRGGRKRGCRLPCTRRNGILETVSRSATLFCLYFGTGCA